MKSAEGSGRTVEEAIREALRILGARREDVDLIVLDEGSRGVLGLGSREARVRLTFLSEEGEEEVSASAEGSLAEVEETGGDPAAVARGVTATLVEAMGFRGSVRAHEDAGAVQVVITGSQLAPLIGRHGQTLEALELLVNLIVARRVARRVPVVVDAERYRERRREALQALASRTATRVRQMGQPVALEPMSASERRVIHTALAADPGVATHSEGEGASRHVVITPRDAPDSASGAGPGDAGPFSAAEADSPQDADTPETSPA
ncbi:MAG TPA: RNA-binding cell elongation regulator Jag/EloR [bacterium]|nr:RNA-binding cell elongation regulator Jag/EloR [bacterium]